MDEMSRYKGPPPVHTIEPAMHLHSSNQSRAQQITTGLEITHRRNARNSEKVGHEQNRKERNT